MKSSSKYSWMVVSLLWVVALLNYMDRQMLSTMRPAMQADIAELKMASNFGYLMSVFLWIYGLMSPVSGLIADRINRKWLIVGSLFVWSAVTFFMGFASTFTQLYILRAIMGISEALYIPAALSMIIDYHSDKTRSLAIGVHMTGLYVGQALGGFGAMISSSYSWQTAFHMLGVVGVGYSLVLILFLKEKRATQKNITIQASELLRHQPVSVVRSIMALLSNFPFLLILLYFAVPSLPGWAIKNWVPTLFAENLKIDMNLAGPLATIVTAASSLLGVLLGGLLSDKWIEQNIRGRIYTSAIGIALTIPSLLLLGLAHSFVYVLSAAFCFGIGYGMFDANNMPILCQFVGSRYRATAYGLMNMVGVFSGALITSFLGKSSDNGSLGADLAKLAFVVLGALCIQLLFLRPVKGKQLN
ncbi:MAG: MFS transporter [Sphingobacteriia bacterium]|nr:MFS transporter [Sphingobacteriia bacterium]